MIWQLSYERSVRTSDDFESSLIRGQSLGRWRTFLTTESVKIVLSPDRPEALWVQFLFLAEYLIEKSFSSGHTNAIFLLFDKKEISVALSASPFTRRRGAWLSDILSLDSLWRDRSMSRNWMSRELCTETFERELTWKELLARYLSMPWRKAFRPNRSNFTSAWHPYKSPLSFGVFWYAFWSKTESAHIEMSRIKKSTLSLWPLF